MSVTADLGSECRSAPDLLLVEKYTKALTRFVVPKEEELLTVEEGCPRMHPDRDIEGYFEWVTVTGRPELDWTLIRPAAIWKIRFIMDEMIRLEREKDGTVDDGEGSEMKELFEYIMEKVEEFDGAPFTWQRICELLVTPLKHYKKALKFLRALDKNTNVVSTVTSNGLMATGAEWSMESENDVVHIEQRFFGKVDEVDGDEAWFGDHAAAVSIKSEINGTETEQEIATVANEPVVKMEVDSETPVKE